MAEALKTPQLIVALDLPRQDVMKSVFLSDKLSKLGREIGRDIGFKLNPSAISHLGIYSLGSFDDQLIMIADMALNQSPKETQYILEDLINAGMRYVTVSATLGRETLELLAEQVSGSKTELIGRTVSTNLTDVDCQGVYGRNSVITTVIDFVNLFADSGYRAVMVPGSALQAIKSHASINDFFVSGIRPKWYQDVGVNDHRKIMSPKKAVMEGATGLIIGEPIYKSKDPLEATRLVLNEMQHAVNNLKQRAILTKSFT